MVKVTFQWLNGYNSHQFELDNFYHMYCYYPITFSSLPTMTLITNSFNTVLCLYYEEKSYFKIRFYEPSTGTDKSYAFKDDTSMGIWGMVIGY